MIRCSSCSAEVSGEARFCPSCGQSISSVSQLPTGLATPSVQEAAKRRSPSSVPVGRLVSSDSGERVGFTPGSILAERYRIIGLLGRGGMGEVYRADDLKLGQPVALKFLPRALSNDAARRERFFAEVRLARQVSHPNVCRVYDVGEVEGLQYLSMEFVDGEDLASLLRRIGRLPPDKALDIAREICAGLAAAHDKGVLHRDLKPANVMVDGRGRARITDFGLAVAAGEAKEAEVSGTPAYMAPEQLAGKAASVRTDIYALGLVLYELYTGRKAFEGASFEELKHKHSHDAPPSPSQISPGFDPVVERVILRCLEKDPARRPGSVAQVAAALPGGDPLAAALAAGETPSPEMVAAAGEEGALSRGKAWALFGTVLLLLALGLAARPFGSDLELAPFPKSPDALEDRARGIARNAGYDAPYADSAYRWRRQYDHLLYRAAHIPSPQRVRELATAEPHPWVFWYRQSPRDLFPANTDQAVREDDPPLIVSGMVRVGLDARGNLMSFAAVPPQLDKAGGSWPEFQPDSLFREAGLDMKRFRRSDTAWNPQSFADWRADWDGSYESSPDVPIHVSAAAYHGKPVAFDVLGPWNKPLRMQERQESAGLTASRLAFVAMVLGVLVVALIFARRNLRLGRGDRRGAFRVSVYMVVLSLASWLLLAHHGASVGDEFNAFSFATGIALFGGGYVWLIYIALEPLMRRKWPELLISWTRLLSGRFRDPLVGRDILVGALLGAARPAVYLAANAVPWFANVPGLTPFPTDPAMLAGPRQFAGELLGQYWTGTISALTVMGLLFLGWVILRKRWLALAVAGLVIAMLDIWGENYLVEVPAAILATTLVLIAITRFGLLTIVASNTFMFILLSSPLTMNFSRWYAGRSAVTLLMLAGLAGAAFFTSLGGKSPLPAGGEDL